MIIKAHENTYHTQKPEDELIFHSNLGLQFTREDFAKVINKFKMTHSFSYKGSPYDNTCIESINAILKNKKQITLKLIINLPSTSVALIITEN